jgi:hypothetical protein
MFSVAHLEQQAACAKPEHLALVDAAFDRARGPAASRMREELCTNCPIGQQCLDEGMTAPVHGVWGGANQHDRILHGAPWPRNTSH